MAKSQYQIAWEASMKLGSDLARERDEAREKVAALEARIAAVVPCKGEPPLSEEEWGTVVDNGEECCFCPFVSNQRCTAYDIEMLHQDACPLCGRTDNHVHDFD